MKSKMIIFSALALIFSACSTGSYVATTWVDDIYFSPGDVPPPVSIDRSAQQERDLRSRSTERVIVSEIRENNEGSRTMSNYIFDGQDVGTYAQAQSYNLDRMELVGTDTTVYYDEDEVKYVINNYFEGDDMDFSYRINRFHRPYFHSPYYYDYYGWDSWYYPYSSFSWSYGMGWGSSWGWPYYGWGSSWRSPYYGWGYPYSSWYSPYYSNWGWGGGFYSPYYSNWGWGNVRYTDSENYRYGQRREYNTSAVYGSGGGSRVGTSAMMNTSTPLKSAQPGETILDSGDRRSGSVSGAAGGGRPAREGVVSGAEQNSRVHTELRRDASETTNTRSRYTSSAAARGQNESAVTTRETRPVNNTGNAVQSQGTTTRNYTGSTQGTYTRPVTNVQRSQTTTGNTYTPSYNQQRTVTRPTYNVQGATRPSSGTQQTVTKSATTPANATYTRPSSTTTNTTNTYRSTSTYTRSSTGTTTGTSRTVAPSTNSSGSISTPARSTSTPASSGGSFSAPARSSTPSSGSSGGFSSGSSTPSSGSSGSSSSSSSGRR